jgi:hypothetical protein
VKEILFDFRNIEYYKFAYKLNSSDIQDLAACIKISLEMNLI